MMMNVSIVIIYIFNKVKLTGVLILIAKLLDRISEKFYNHLFRIETLYNYNIHFLSKFVDKFEEFLSDFLGNEYDNFTIQLYLSIFKQFVIDHTILDKGSTILT